MAHQYSGAGGHFGLAGYGRPSGGRHDEDDEEFYDDEDDSYSEHKPGVDKIKRNYLQQQQSKQQPQQVDQSQQSSGPETIRVELDESYFGKEKRFLINVASNLRSKLNSMQMFNPAKNVNIKEQQETWNESVSVISRLFSLV